ncbi:MAG: DUF3368 domain-containing protein [Candidatus Sumerlaeota bacterium]|nr:DUF3368 domain-containing protein [Candidatus Sumerlaeota bacterium]
MTPNPVVSDSSPLIALHQVGQMGILRGLFETVFVPSAVAREIGGMLSLPNWVIEKAVTEPIRTSRLRLRLDLGESQCLALGFELHARWLILDDLAARKAAGELGFEVAGTLGILLRAKRRGLLSRVGPVVEDLIQHEFRASPDLLKQILLEAGEDAT